MSVVYLLLNNCIYMLERKWASLQYDVVLKTISFSKTIKFRVLLRLAFVGRKKVEEEEPIY